MMTKIYEYEIEFEGILMTFSASEWLIVRSTLLDLANVGVPEGCRYMLIMSDCAMIEPGALKAFMVFELYGVEGVLP